MKRLFVWLTAVLMLICLCTGCSEKAPADPVPENVKGLVVQVADGVTVSLSTEFEDGTPLSPTNTYEGNGYTYYHYANLLGIFRCKAFGAGRYTETTNIVMTEEKNEIRYMLDLTPGETDGAGWAPKSFSTYTEELTNGGFISDLSLWPQYSEVLTSPYFTGEHQEHQITTQSQLEAYLAELDDPDDDLYIYSAGTSSLYRHDIPMVVFTLTDLSTAENAQQAAALMGQDKPTVLYRCQMHGNEPAGGEAALVMINWLDGKLGEELLEKINICVIPRQNPDGAQNYERTMIGGIDPNRDSLRLKTAEIASYMKICQWFDPELIIDGHEYNAHTAKKTLTGGDILVGLGYTVENSDAFRSFNLEISNKIFAAMTENLLDYRYYSNYVNSVNPSLSRAYASMQGTMFVLLESRGIGNGLGMYERRIVSQIVSAETLLRFVAENADRLQQVVDAERQMIIDQGAVYSQNTKISLATSGAEDLTLRHPGRKQDQITGIPQEVTTTPYVYTNVTRSRIAPTAYVIPAGEGFTESVLQLMDKHSIAYTFIPAGSVVKLQQYDKNESDYLTDEKTVTFPNGAYVFCRNQVRGNILSVLMEPDVDNVEEYKGTLVQQEMISQNNGCYALYRYIHNLNEDGFIDYK